MIFTGRGTKEVAATVIETVEGIIMRKWREESDKDTESDGVISGEVSSLSNPNPPVFCNKGEQQARQGVVGSTSVTVVVQGGQKAIISVSKRIIL